MTQNEGRKPKPEHELSKGEGSFYFRTSDQRWIGVIDLGRDEAGKRNRIIVSDRDEDKAWEKFQAKRRVIFDQVQNQGERKSAEEVISVARSLGLNPVEALVFAGYLYFSEV